ncbi:nucleotidyl transferase AbiEii/AbiGii toxin family protein [candidate division TA06 bacterium]|nr:nucleotidyl transferase AbiEii/AbiGii toxin family protein [candidate division TA06 bacterium]
MTDTVENIKRIAVSSIFSDDTLRDIFVLKGGNALNLVYKVTSRSSLDIDLSISTSLDSYSLQKIKVLIKRALKEGYSVEGFTLFDYSFRERPQKIMPGIPPFWGGYRIEYKVIQNEKYSKQDINTTRKHALSLTTKHNKIFSIDISKYEYCETKIKRDLQGYVIFTYSPEMILFEKLRAICQQTDEYNKIFGKSHKEQRARDFFDIFSILENINISWNPLTHTKLIRNIFKAKKVPLTLLSKIHKYREMHRIGYDSLKDTVYHKEEVKDFNFYFDYVLSFIVKLKTFRII